MALTARSQQARNLHLSIDPSPYRHGNVSVSPDSGSPSSSSYISQDSEGTTPTSTGSDNGVLCSVLCMYDFQSTEPIHLPFHKNEILDIVKQEDTGWWAAMRPGGDMVGWVPEAFVKPLSEEMADRLLNVREELRVYEYEAEQLYTSAPITHLPLYDPDPEPVAVSPRASGSRDPFGREPPPSSRRPYPPSPMTPMPQPPPATAAPSISAPINKPTPPTPTDQPDFPIHGRDRSVSAPGTYRNANRRPQPMSTLSETDTSNGLVSRAVRPPNDKITRLTGSEDARVFHQGVQAQANLPWFLRPKFTDQLQIDSDGQVRSGSITALVEKLTCDTLTKDPIKTAQDTAFRNVFLMTFRTFMTADKLFDMLVDTYRMEPPLNLGAAEFDEWREKFWVPTQCRVLTIFTVWLEDHRLLEEEPQIAQRLTHFLGLIASPSPQALTARLIVKTIERLTFANPSSATTNHTTKRSRKSRPHKGDLLRLDPLDIAEQLALMEHSLYEKITPQECIKYARTQSGKAVAGLTGFCATHDKLVAWVQSTILNNEQLGKRADTVDFWIKVAEKCRSLNNFASMSAVINALSSTVITRLHLTWAHVGKKSTFDALLKFNDPMGGFSGYRGLQLNAEGPCTPFIGMYLTDIVHIQDQWSEDGRVSFIQCQRWYEVISVMLRFQPRRYPFGENDATLTFITGHIRAMSAGSKDQAKFWARSQEVQQSELAHADIRRGLEAAGF